MTRGYDYKNHAVLVVDDELQALKYFEKVFSSDFRVLTAANAADAWKLIQDDSNKVGVLITDQRMPAESGVDLLSRTRNEQPHIVRILTTAYSDLKSAVDAVNSGGAFWYVSKPWNLPELKGVLMRAMEFFLVRQERDRLLREKLSVLQRMMVMDRVRGLAALAAALQGSLRNSLGALQAYVAQAPVEKLDTLRDDHSRQVDLHSLARSEGEFLVRAVGSVLEGVKPREVRFDSGVDIGALVTSELNSLASSAPAEGVQLHPEVLPLTPTVRADGALLKRLLRLVINRLSDMDGADRLITIQVGPQKEGKPGVKVAFKTNGQEWQNGQVASLYSAVIAKQGWLMGLDMDMLTAFFIVHHHGGAIQIHPSPPLGPGIEIRLPAEPESQTEARLDAAWFDDVFACLGLED